MAIFQPSNITPSTFGGVGNGTIDASDNVKISWQVNGNSPMTAFIITVYEQNSSTALHDTGLIAINGFYPTDNKGNPQFYTYEPTSTLWSSWGLTNGNSYKLKITQFWGANPTISSTNKTVQYSESAFISRSKPTGSITYDNATLSQGTVIDKAIAVFTANYSQAQNDAINWAQWQFASILDGGGINIVDDTGAISTSELSYTADGLLAGNNYSIRCIVETENGQKWDSGWIGFAVAYTSSSSSAKITLSCQKDDSVLITWGDAKSIVGTATPSSGYAISDNRLLLDNGANVEWDDVSGDALSFATPYSISWRGKLPSITPRLSSQTKTLTAVPEETTETKTISGVANMAEFTEARSSSTYHPTDRIVTDGNDTFWGFSGTHILKTTTGRSWTETGGNFSAVDVACGNGKVVYINSTNPGRAYYTDGFSWLNTNLHTHNAKYIAYGNGVFVVITSIGMTATSTDASTWTSHSGVIGVRDYSGLEFCNGEFIALSGDKLYHSTDGVNWSITTLSVSYTWNSVTYGNNMYYLLSAVQNTTSAQYIYASTNLTNWSLSQVLSANIGYADKLLYVNGIFFLTPYTGTSASEYVLRYATTGLLNWETKTITYPTSYVAYANNLFVLSQSCLILNWYFRYFHIPNKWVHSYTVNSSSGITSYSVSSQVNYTDAVAITLHSSTPTSVSINITFTYYSGTSTASETYNFTSGSIISVNVLSKTPATAEVTATATRTTFTYAVSVPTATKNTASTSVTVYGAVNYILAQDYSGIPNVVETNNLRFGLVFKTPSGNNQTLKEYAFVVYDKTTSSYLVAESENTIPLFNLVAEDMLAIISNNHFYLYNVNVGGTISRLIFDKAIAYNQSAITDVKLNGEQDCDYLYITKKTLDGTNYTPYWDENTYFYANFETDLQAGTSNGASVSSVIYREKKGENRLTRLAKISQDSGAFKVKDYGNKSLSKYTYELFYVSPQDTYSNPSRAVDVDGNIIYVCRQFNAYTLLETVADEENADVYHVLKVWRFGNNISAGSVSNNNSPNFLSNFTKYPLRQISSQAPLSGSLSALLSNAKNNKYADTAEQMERLFDISTSPNTFFLKDMKGNLYMVGIGGAITQTINTKSNVQEVTVSISWREIGSADGVAIIQLPTDEGWTEDEDSQSETQGETECQQIIINLLNTPV